MKKPAFLLSILTLGFILFACAWSYSREVAQRKTESLVRYAAADIRQTLNPVSDTVMLLLARRVMAQVEECRPRTLEYMQELAKTHMLDEINIVNREGRIVGSSDPNCIDVSMFHSPLSAEFMILTNGVTESFSQPFRQGASNPLYNRKYEGLAFPEGNGFIQVGVDALRIAREFSELFDGVFETWEVGDCGYYLVADGEGRIVFPAPGHPEVHEKLLTDIGFKEKDFQAVETTFKRTVLGARSSCRAVTYAGHTIVTVVPDSEFIHPAQIQAVIYTAVLIGLLVFFSALVLHILRKDAEIGRLRAEEDRRREEDLATAKSIQTSALPSIFPPYPHELRMDIHATMDPAKEVGGDFYDFFYVSPDKFVVIVADVSGKGIPAAMFMMKAKMLIKSLACTVDTMEDFAAEVNRRLCEGNEALMFVTAWIGCVDLTNGNIDYINAGHNPPCIRRADGRVEQLEGVSGLFFGGMDNIPYKMLSAKLEKGDLLYLYTDGVTEAINEHKEQFGEKRLKEELKMSGAPALVCSRMKGAVDAFAGLVPQFDDVTMLAFYYRGKPRTESRVFSAVTASIPAISAYVEELLAAAECPKEILNDVLVAVDEIVNNVVSYSGSPEIETVYEEAELPPVIRLTFVDRGKPWNPLSHIDPDVTAAPEDRAVGGLGILIVKSLMNNVFYEYRDGCNRLSFRKELPWRI